MGFEGTGINFWSRGKLPKGLEDLGQLLVVWPRRVLVSRSNSSSRISIYRGNEAAARRSSTNARMIAMFTATARLLRRTLESIATPCSVNT
jgi:hypothetical protein